ncbi:MAG: tRNA guanosine(34) transglycosylase Tgt [Desulfatirhabdiaceae bacterium]
MNNFSITSRSSETRARTGALITAHGAIETPVFMPVGTLATVKSLSPEDLTACGAEIILGNTYHLYLRPGCDVIGQFSGLHRFMNWHGPILTDSGGFQIFSLARLRRITDEGADFQSHIDGSRHMLTPEKSIEIQLCLNADIVMCLDQCIAYPSSRDETVSAMDLTTRWAGRCQDFFRQECRKQNLLFGIVQGGMEPDLRAASADALVEMGFNGYAIGGLSVGEPSDLMLEMADAAIARLPDSAPRYVMGVGTPENLVDMVALGVDMFDCVLPTRNGRNGQLFTHTGVINITNARHRMDSDPVETGCACYTCQNYSRAYLRHLFMSREILAYRLNTIHNIHYYVNLIKEMRRAVNSDSFDTFRKNFYHVRSGDRDA